MRNGLVLHPSKSMVRNGGFDGSGVHCGTEDVLQQVDMRLYDGNITMPEGASVSSSALKSVCIYLLGSQSIVSRLKLLMG